MQPRSIGPFGIACFLLAVNVGTVGALEPSTDGPANDQVKSELEALGTEYMRVAQERVHAMRPDGGDESDNGLSDDEWLRQGREQEANLPDPDELLLPRFFALASAHPESPYALDALAFVIRRGGPQTGDVLGKPWQLKEVAIDALAKHHMDDPRVVHVFDSLSGSIPSPKTEAFLRRAFEHDPKPAVRAAAGLSLARYYHNIDRCLERSKRINDKARPLNSERFWKLVVTPYLEGFSFDPAQLSAEMNRLLAIVVKEYSDVAAADWKLAGTGHVFLETEAHPRPTSYGKLAKTLQFELNNLVPGKRAPEIEGLDAEGKSFRLSDYRGKVVLLTFSADWCGGCIELYPLERKLVDKFRNEPFVLLSVSRDESIDTLKSSLAAGKITWRCWWDGMQGPIHEAWNSPGAPTLFLLNHEGVIQDVHLSRFTRQGEFEQAIAALLTKASRP